MQIKTSSLEGNWLSRLFAAILRIFIALLIPGLTFYILLQGFFYLRADDASKLTITLVAIVWGVVGTAVLYYVFNWFVEQLPDVWTARLQPFIFVGPAIAILTWFLALPTVRTMWISFFGRNGPPEFTLLEIFTNPSAFFKSIGAENVGLSNYQALFTQRDMQEAIRNNIGFWILVATPLTVLIGLIVAVLADRSKFEKLAKSLIFMPMAISFVGAGVIWNFIYEIKPLGTEQIGLLNSIVVWLGGEPRAWTAFAEIAPWNNLFLVVIVVWLQTGFSMVLFSAAIKGIPQEIIEAAKVDGANEFNLFFKITIPSIMGTIITVSTTVVIFTLKIFDVVWVMTGGQFGTGVIATQFYRQSFTARNAGYGAAIAVFLFLCVTPVMIYNLRQFRDQEAF